MNSLKLLTLFKVIETLDYKEHIILVNYLLKDAKIISDIVKKAIINKKKYFNSIKSDK